MTLGLMLLVLLLFVAPFIMPTSKKNQNDLWLTVSTFPLYDIVKNIAKERANVLMLIPFGVDIHTFEPTPKDRVALQKSKVFIFSGSNLEPWTNALEHNNSIDMSSYVILNELQAGDIEHHHKNCNNAHYDPHYWLNIDNMIASANVIAKELSRIDPNSKLFFEKNLKTYIEQLEQLKSEYAQALSTCKKDLIIVNHNAFGYLSSAYGFHVKSLSGFSTDALPSAQSMKALIDAVREYNISIVFFEPFSSDRLMQTVANEANTTVATLHPLANISHSEAASKKSYIRIMRENLEKLSQALACQ